MREIITVPEWDNRLWEETNGLNRTIHWPGFWHRSDLLRDLIASMFETFDDAYEQPVLRVYINGGHQHNLAERFIHTPGLNNTPFEQWINRILGHNEFCLTLNGLMRWSNRFHFMMHDHILNPLFAVTGFPPGDADFYAFIGNYGFTPFGVHDDEELSFILHLGPSSKQAYVWPDGSYLNLKEKRLTGSGRSSGFEGSLDYTLQPGNLLFIAKGDHHIFNCTDFAITLGLTIFPCTVESEMIEGAKLLCEENAETETFFLNDKDWTAPALTLYSQSLNGERGLKRNHIACAMWRSKMRLKSNGYITTSPRELSVQLSDFQLKHQLFHVPMQFKLYYFISAGIMEISVRGRSKDD